MPKHELHVYADAAAVATAMADMFLDIGQTAMADRGIFTVAFAGGNTPRAAYSMLALEPRCDQMPWSDVHVYYSDERCVPPDDDQSNYRMSKTTLLSKIPIPETNVHRMDGEIDPPKAAAEYAALLRNNLGDPPVFDLVLLGMGPDGHTASLFPGSPPDADNASLVRAIDDASKGWRITMTPMAINAARTVIFTVEGVAKATALAAVLQGPRDPSTYPAQIVDPGDRISPVP